MTARRTARVIAQLRDLIRPESEGGGAALVRLAADEPVDEHGYVLDPMLGVAVADILRILEDDTRPRVTTTQQFATLDALNRFAQAQRCEPAARRWRAQFVRRTVFTVAGPHLPGVRRSIMPGAMPLLQREVEETLRRHRQPCTAATIRAAVEPALGYLPEPNEVIAVLAALAKLGKATIVNGGGTWPGYLYSAHDIDEHTEQSLAVPLAEALADAGHNVTAADLMATLRGLYSFPAPVTLPRFAAAISTLIARHLAVRVAPGCYRATTNPVVDDTTAEVEHDHGVYLDGRPCPACGYVASMVPAGTDRHA